MCLLFILSINILASQFHHFFKMSNNILEIIRESFDEKAQTVTISSNQICASESFAKFLTCCLCISNLVYKGKRCDSCDFHACRPCYNSLREFVYGEKITCPTCRDKNGIKPDPLSRPVLLDGTIEHVLQIACRDSCGWSGLLKDHEQHLKNCSKVQITCPWPDCVFEGTYLQVEQHALDANFHFKMLQELKLQQEFSNKNKRRFMVLPKSYKKPKTSNSSSSIDDHDILADSDSDN